MTRSISEAVRTDARLLFDVVQAEESERRDRETAFRIAGLAVPRAIMPAPVTSSDVDDRLLDVMVRDLDTLYSVDLLICQGCTLY